jgi:hypothetical protein
MILRFLCYRSRFAVFCLFLGVFAMLARLANASSFSGGFEDGSGLALPLPSARELPL